MSKLSYISLCVIAHENLDKLDSPLGESKGDLPLLLEIQKPGGFWCIFAYFLYIRK